MKEKIAKVASLHAEIAKSISEGKTDEAIAKLTEATTEVEGLSTDAEAIETEAEAIEKKVQTEIKKYADMYVSADNLPELIEQILGTSKSFQSVAGGMTDITKRLETVEKTSSGSNQLDGTGTQIKKSTGSVSGELSGFFG